MGAASATAARRCRHARAGGNGETALGGFPRLAGADGHFRTAAFEGRLGEVAIGCEATRCAFADDVRREFDLIGLPALDAGEGDQPVVLVLLVEGIGHESDNVAVARYERFEHRIALRLTFDVT